MSEEGIASVAKSKSQTYLRKARQFAASMDQAFSGRRYDAATRAGVHATISLCDALTVHHLGLRSAAQEHGEVLKLLSRIHTPPTFLAQVRASLALKNRVEYEAREVTPAEAAEMVKRVGRVLAHVESELEP